LSEQYLAAVRAANAPARIADRSKGEIIDLTPLSPERPQEAARESAGALPLDSGPQARKTNPDPL